MTSLYSPPTPPMFVVQAQALQEVTQKENELVRPFHGIVATHLITSNSEEI